MLTKLLKYDFKALNRVMVPLQLGVLIAGILGSFLLKFSVNGLTDAISSSYNSYDSGFSTLQSIINTTTMMLTSLFFAAVFASFWITLFLIARHLYKSFLRDEGYLTFTLPVSTHQLLLSKTIAGFVWLLVNLLLLMGIFVFMTLVGFGESTEFLSSQGLMIYRDILLEVSNAQGFVFILELCVFVIVMAVQFVLQLYFSLILGGVVAKNYKVFAGIGFYIASNIVMQTILSFVLALGLVFVLDSSYLFNESNWVGYLQPVIIPAIITNIAFVITYYLVSNSLLKNKLNLE